MSAWNRPWYLGSTSVTPPQTLDAIPSVAVLNEAEANVPGKV